MTQRIALSKLLDDDARAALNSGLAKIRAAVIEDGATILVPGFGTFRQKHRPERQARNPQTGETFTAPPSTTMVFRPAKVRT